MISHARRRCLVFVVFDVHVKLNWLAFRMRAEEDYDAFCLAYMFTYRDFEMGTLGLAWTGGELKTFDEMEHEHSTASC